MDTARNRCENARRMKEYIGNIRAKYTRNFTSAGCKKRQIAVATYLIDKHSFGAGSKKGDNELGTGDCCTLKVDNVKAIAPNLLQFNYGKDSITETTVEVELPVYEAIIEFQAGKHGSADLFDKLDTCQLNKHLNKLMPGLTSNLFHTYNASIKLDNMLNKETKEGDVLEHPLVVLFKSIDEVTHRIYNNLRTSTISECNNAYERKMHEINIGKAEVKAGMDRLRRRGCWATISSREKLLRKTAELNFKAHKIRMEARMETKPMIEAWGSCIAKYCDPRILVAWCRQHELPIEKIYGNAQTMPPQFAWAMDVAPDFRF